MHDVAVLHHVLLTLNPDLALVAAGLFGTQRHIVVVLDDFGTDEAPLEIGVDDAGGLFNFEFFIRKVIIKNESWAI